ncbi:MAG: DNA internalization-related competence protein ComEC/Rec2 [Desulfobacteraceae bacterium IS3]|nr:MAG: DNA internalization-related competence protein ComEC/Rec2 [Desulfobacteraceae bacterium IS3]
MLIALMVGLVLGANFPGQILSGCGVALICVLMIVRDILRRESAAISPLLLFAAIGYLTIQPYLSPILPPNHVSRFADGKDLEITGVIADEPVQNEKRVKFILKAETLNQKEAVGKIRVTTDKKELNPELHFGDRISITGKLKRPHNFKNPGGFDYERFLAFQKIWVTAYAKKISKKDPEKGLRWHLEDPRRNISDFIKQYGEGKEETELLRASIMGDQSGISQDTYTQFQRVGVAHLIAISGLNIAVIGSVAFAFFRWFLSQFRFFLFRAWSRKVAAILSMFPVIYYGLISGMAPPALRSVVMVLVFQAAIIFEKEGDPINTLTVAAMLILAAHPPSLFSVSFQLSFSAIFAIIYGAPHFIRNQSEEKSSSENSPQDDNSNFDYIKRKLNVPMYSSLCAVLGTLPIGMLYFHQASLIGLLANIVFIPIYSYLVVVPGLASVFAYLTNIPAASYGISFCAKVLNISLSMLKACSDLSFAAITTITPSYLEIVLFYALCWALLNIRQKIDEFEKIEKIERIERIIKIAKITLIVILVAGIGDAGYWTYQRYFHKNLRITFLDVGQGNSALIELPGGQCILIDGGGLFDSSILDVGSGVIAPFLLQKKIMTVDTLVLTHAHEDHIGGLPYIAKNFNVKQVWMNGHGEETETYHNFNKIIQQKGIDAPQFSNIFGEHEINNVKLNILHPEKDFSPHKNLNVDSIVLKLEFKDISILFTGDIDKKVEKKLVDKYQDALKSTILVAPHHGSKSSSSDMFLDAVKPEYVVISLGWKNRFHFPKSEIIARYLQHKARIFRTDLNGAISVSTDGNSLEITPVTDALQPVE